MKASDIKIDFKKLEKLNVQDTKERLEFIELWANYVKTHKDEDWSEQQNVIINSQMNSG